MSLPHVQIDRQSSGPEANQRFDYPNTSAEAICLDTDQDSGVVHTAHDSAIRGAPEPRRESRGHEIALRITPSMFSLNMGTGIVSILLFNFPYPAGWLRRVCIVIHGFNIVLFIAISCATIYRYVRWKRLLSTVLVHPQTGMFWGTLPMGFVTIVVSGVQGIQISSVLSFESC